MLHGSFGPTISKLELEEAHPSASWSQRRRLRTQDLLQVIYRCYLWLWSLILLLCNLSLMFTCFLVTARHFYSIRTLLLFFPSFLYISVIWKSGNNYIDVYHTKFEAKSARDGSWYGDSCAWSSYFAFWLQHITYKFFNFQKSDRGRGFIYTRYCSHLNSGQILT